MESKTPGEESFGQIEAEGSYGLINAKILIPTMSLRWKITKQTKGLISGGEMQCLEQLYQDVNSSYYEWRPIEIVYEEN